MISYDHTKQTPARNDPLFSNKPYEKQIEAAIIDKADNGEISEFTVVAEGEERVTWFIWVLIICSSISGLLFGASSPRRCIVI